MFGRISAIALNTYRESVRARILIGLAGVAFAMSFYSLIVGTWTLRTAPRVVSDVGSASMSIFSIAVAVLIPATSLHRELEQKTIFPILARPIRRSEYLVGKYAGTLLTLGVFILADAGLILLIGAALAGRSMALVAAAGALPVIALVIASIRSSGARTFGPIPFAVAFLGIGAILASAAPDERQVVLASSLLTFSEVAIVAAVAMFFASFSTPFLSSLLTVWVWIIGRQADTLASLPARIVGDGLRSAGAVASSIVPNLYDYVPPRPLLTGEAVDANLSHYLVRAAIMAVAWSVGLLAAASFIFKRRDFL